MSLKYSKPVSTGFDIFELTFISTLIYSLLYDYIILLSKYSLAILDKCLQENIFYQTVAD